MEAGRGGDVRAGVHGERERERERKRENGFSHAKLNRISTCFQSACPFFPRLIGRINTDKTFLIAPFSHSHT